MTLTDLIPALKGPGRRRAVDKVAELRDENRRLLTIVAGADDAFALLHQALAEAHAKQGDAEEIVVQQQADIDELTTERDGLLDEVLMFRARFGAQLAAEANAAAVTVPPMVRDTTAIEDQATGPIYVRPLQEAAAAGLLGPVTDPGRVAR
ncbi:hypothetical protein M2155_000668 [Streptomyces sp. SAI-119]|uniref:hypothetical protein n=1 Tax=Streptomyces sp. SAI-119 TaxID=2940541 RepID=UPI002472EA1B|nr:hypothetical protein [Streptomyces sp. SAI-119]MDH6448260.1 hypothetical protein [Streptomyces sp. SAI-119]